ncbi:MAG: AAA family ATPase, partial [Ignavibacteriales bacterium]
TDRAINQASGGILLIDEAYTLAKQGNQQDFGQEAIDILLKRMEDRKDDFVVIAAGYPAKMQEFINSNPGLKSRFTHFFHFDDYTPDELIAIFKHSAAEEDFVIADDSLDLLKKEFIRLYRKRDESFGNARIAKKYLTDIKLNVSRRLSGREEELPKEAFTLITREDVENLFTNGDKKKFIFNIDEDKLELLMEKLNILTGLAGVKKEINEIIKLTRYYIENGEDPQKSISGHLVFLGNPGTGKTTVARLFSEIYSALGILPKGHLVEVDRQALVAQYVGQTAIKTKEVIDSAIGGTLFIDEVYSLLKKNESDFGRESIDTLIKRMEDDKGKFILITAGYTDETNEFLAMNPGLSSRFYKKIYFDDYSPDELHIISLKFLEDKKLKPDEESGLLLRKFFTEAYERRDKRFGNARFVRNITDKIIRNHLLYIAGLNRTSRTEENTSVISASVIKEILNESKDWIKGTDSEPEYILQELNDLTGLTEVKKSALKLISSLRVVELREKRGLKSVPRVLHSVFYGSPGTGKATVAKIFGDIYKNIGILSKGHIVPVNKLNMSGIYVGQSKQKTQEFIQKAAGGILYIEDAEYLQQDLTPGSEILDALLEGIAVNHEDIIYIISGNRKSFADEIRNNSVISKYFVNYFYFEDFEPRQLVEIAYRLAETNSYRLDEGALQLMMDLFTNRYSEGKTKENARLVKDILYKSISFQEERLFNYENPSDDELITITYEDVIKAAREF